MSDFEWGMQILRDFESKKRTGVLTKAEKDCLLRLAMRLAETRQDTQVALSPYMKSLLGIADDPFIAFGQGLLAMKKSCEPSRN